MSRQQQQKQKKNRYRDKLVNFFNKITSGSRVAPEQIIQDMKDKINNDTQGTDYLNKLNLNEGSTLRSELNELIREDGVSRGGGQGHSSLVTDVAGEKQEQQTTPEERTREDELFSVVNIESTTWEQANELARALLATTTAMTTLYEDNVDYELVSSCLTMLNNSLLWNNKYSYQIFHDEVAKIKSKEQALSGVQHQDIDENMMVIDEVNQCQDTDCEEVNTKISYLNSIDDDVHDADDDFYPDKDGYRIINGNIYDPQTENLSRDIRNQQLDALRQSRITDYFPPVIDFIPPPKKIYLIDNIWPSATTERRCLQCTKKKETPGFSFNLNEYYSNTTVKVSSSVLWSLLNNERIMQGNFGGESRPAYFCTYCAHRKELQNLISDEDDFAIQEKLNEYTARFIEHIRQQQQERNRESVANRQDRKTLAILQGQAIPEPPPRLEMRRPLNNGQSTGVGRSFLSETGAPKTQNLYGILGERTPPRTATTSAQLMVQTSSDDDGDTSSISSYDVGDGLWGGKRSKKKTKRKKRKKKKTRRKKRKRKKKKTKRRRRRKKKTRRKNKG